MSCRKKYPDRKILLVDSLGASSGYGLLMDRLADLRDEGKSVDEVFAWAVEHRLSCITGSFSHRSHLLRQGWADFQGLRLV